MLGFAIPFDVYIDDTKLGTLSNNSSLTTRSSLSMHEIKIISTEKDVIENIELSEDKKEVTITIIPKMGLISAKPYIKEIKYYFSIPVYVLNTLIGAVMYLGIGIVIKVLGLNKILLYLRSLSSISPSISSHPEMIIVLLFSLIITLTVTTAASISLEGKQFWIVKAIPVNPIHLFIAKILVNLTITIIPVLVSTPLLASVIGWKYTWMIFLIPMLSSIFSAIAGLYVNIMYPKLDWENEEIPLKRSIASFLGTFVGGLIMVVPFVAYLAGLYTLFSTFQYAVIVVGYQLLFIAFVTTLLVTRGVKYFNKISI